VLRDILASVPASSIDDVVAIMTTIDGRLADSDGLKWFNRLYLRVTERVLEAVAVGAFADARFLTEFDVIFANLYFEALVRGERDMASAPSAWKPLLQVRTRAGLARIQFALAGMNAHINRDLPAGLVTIFEALGGDPFTADVQRRDFDAINDILERVLEEVGTEFAVGLVGVVDTLAGNVDEVVAMWNVRKARAAAWTNAEVLWTLKPAPLLHARFFEKLDGLTGLASRGLLLPISPVR
jgi:Family of unknown function (DUF5995)